MIDFVSAVSFLSCDAQSSMARIQVWAEKCEIWFAIPLHDA